MKALLHYLGKEWRDQRVIVLGLVCALPPLLALAAWGLPTKAFTDAPFAPFTALACLAISVFALSSDLLPGEERRNTLEFLRRMPAGLGRAFAAKLVFFLGALAGLALYGFLAGALTTWVVGGVWPAFPDLRFLPGVGGLTLAALLLGWLFATSACVPRGVLAVPALLLVSGLLLLPLIWLYRANGGLGPGPWVLRVPFFVILAGGWATAWFAFVRGRGRGGGWAPAARRGLVCALLCMLPVYGHAGYDALEYNGHLGGERLIADAMIGEGGRYAFANTFRRLPGVDRNGHPRFAPATPMIIDLQTGEAREVGGKGSSFHSIGIMDRVHRASNRAVPQRYVFLLDDGVIPYEARSARRLGDSISRKDPGEEWLRRLCEESRRTAPWRTADGRRVWAFDGAIEAETAGGGIEELYRGHWASSGARACGAGLVFGGNWGYLDLQRGKLYARRDLKIRGFNDLYVLPDRWLLGRFVPADKTYEWRLFDPDSGESELALGLEGERLFLHLSDDGRVFRRPKGSDSVLLTDPATGHEQEIALDTPFGQQPHIGDPYVLGSLPGPVRTPEGARVYVLRTDNKAALARFDADTSTLVFARGTLAIAQPFVSLLCCLDEERALVLVEDKLIAEVRFGTDEYRERFRLP